MTIATPGRIAHALSWMILTIAVGCNRSDSADPQSAGTPATAPTASTAQTEQPFREMWDSQYLQGAKVGYFHTAFYREENAGPPVVRVETVGQVTLVRAGQQSLQTTHEKSWETETGQLLRFQTRVQMGPTPQVTIGRVVGQQLELTLQTPSNVTRQSIPWGPDVGGSAKVTMSLFAQPMQPGESRRLRAFLPVFNSIGEIVLTARAAKESTSIGSIVRELLRIDVKNVFAGVPPLESVAWMDESGDVLKTEVPAMQMVALRTTEQEAKTPVGGNLPDLMASTMVKVDPPIVEAHRSQMLRFRVSLTGGDATAAFPNRASQFVRRLDEHSAEIAVTAIRPGTQPTDVIDTAPTDSDRRPSSFVQSNDPVVAKLAADAAGAETDPWTVATKLESFVRGYLESVQFSEAFATAADVARTRRGDCSEHAVLLCALLRARGIPARTVAGLVYVEGAGAFGYHMWCEGYFGDRWIGLDATLGRGGISAAYLKVAEASLEGVDSLKAVLPVAQLLGRLKIEVLERQ